MTEKTSSAKVKAVITRISFWRRLSVSSAALCSFSTSTASSDAKPTRERSGWAFTRSA
jgi:hypothetical protein